MAKRIAAVVCTALIMLGCAACSGDGANSKVRIAVDAVPTTLDPQLAANRSELLIARNSFEGLMRIGSDGRVVCAAAEDYAISNGALTYIFTLRDGLKWSDGSDCTADHFVFGIRRALSPETAAPQAYLLKNIKNAEAVLSGKKQPSELGVTAEGNKVIITLERADSNLLQALTCSVAMPCNRQFFEQSGGKYGLYADSTLNNGSFALSRWNDSSVTLIRNKEYSGDFKAAAYSLSVSFGVTAADRVNGLGSNMYDIAVVEPQNLQQAADDNLKTVSYTDTCWAVVYNNADGFLSADGVIAAMSAAIGGGYKSALPSGFSQTGSLIADDLTVGTGSYGSSAPTPYSGNLSRAKTTVQKAVKKHGTHTLTLKYVNTDGMQLAASQVATSWQQSFGITVNLVAVEHEQMLQSVAGGDYQIAIYPLTAADGRALSVFSSPVISSHGGLIGSVSALTAAADEDDVRAAILTAEQRVISSGAVVPLMSSGLCCAYTDDIRGLSVDMHQGNFDLYNTRT